MSFQFTTLNSDINSRQWGRNVARDSSGRIWVTGYNDTAERIEVWYSENEGTSFSEATSLRIEGPILGDSLRSSLGQELHINAATGVAVLAFSVNVQIIGLQQIVYYSTAFSPTSTWQEAFVFESNGTLENCPSAVSFQKPNSTNFIVAAIGGHVSSSAIFKYREYDAGGTWTNIHDTISLIGNPSYYTQRGRHLLDFKHTGGGSVVDGSPDLFFVTTNGYNAKFFRFDWSDTFPYYSLALSNQFSTNANNEYMASGFYDGERFVWFAQSNGTNAVRLTEINVTTGLATVLVTDQLSPSTGKAPRSVTVGYDSYKNILAYVKYDGVEKPYRLFYYRAQEYMLPYEYCSDMALPSASTDVTYNFFQVQKTIGDTEEYVYTDTSGKLSHVQAPGGAPYIGNFLPFTARYSPIGEAKNIDFSSDGTFYMYVVKWDDFIGVGEIWYSTNGGETWAKSNSLSTGIPASNMARFTIDRKTDRAILWAYAAPTMVDGITPTSTWTTMDELYQGLYVNSSGPHYPTPGYIRMPFMHFGVPNSTDYIVVFGFQMTYQETNGSQNVVYMSQLNASRFNSAGERIAIFPLAAGNSWTYTGINNVFKVEYNHIGDGSTFVDEDNVELYVFWGDIQNSELKFKTLGIDFDTNTWTNEVTTQFIPADWYTSSSEKLFDMLYDGEEAWCMWKSANQVGPNIKSINTTNKIITTRTPSGSAAGSSMPSATLGITSIGDVALYVIDAVTTDVFRNVWIKAQNTWAGYEKVAKATVYNEPPLLNTYENVGYGMILIWYVRLDTYKYKWAYDIQSFWIGSRFRITNGLRALFRLANGTATAFRTTDGKRL